MRLTTERDQERVLFGRHIDTGKAPVQCHGGNVDDDVLSGVCGFDFQFVYPNVDVVRLLIGCGIAVNTRNELHSTPLHVAANPYNFDAVVSAGIYEQVAGPVVTLSHSFVVSNASWCACSSTPVRTSISRTAMMCGPAR